VELAVLLFERALPLLAVVADSEGGRHLFVAADYLTAGSWLVLRVELLGLFVFVDQLDRPVVGLSAAVRAELRVVVVPVETVRPDDKASAPPRRSRR